MPRMIFARRAGVEVERVERDPSAPRAVPRPTDFFYYDAKERKKIEAFLFAKGWTLETYGGRKKYISPEGKGDTNRENHTLNVVVWFYFPQFLKVNSEERTAELAREQVEEEARWKPSEPLYSAENSPPLHDGDCDTTTSSTSTANGGTSYSFVGDAEGLLETMTKYNWVVQQHEVTLCRRYIPPKNLATSSTPYYNLADVAHDFYESFLTTYTDEPLPPMKLLPHAAKVAAFLEDDDASSLCLGFDDLKLTSAVRMDIDEESNETNPFTAKWRPPLTQRSVSTTLTFVSFDPDDSGIDKSDLSREFSFKTSKCWRSRWPPGGLWRRLKNGHCVNITRPEDARVGDLYVIQDGMYKDHTLYVRNLMWEVGNLNGNKRGKFTEAEADAYNKDGKLPAACKGKTVVIGIRYSFVNPLQVNHTIPTCFAWADRKVDGTALTDLVAWKEMIAQRPYGLCCSTCDSFVGKPVFSKDGEVLYYQTVTQFDQDGVDPRHKSPGTVGIAYREWELRQGISEWKCRMCHSSKSASEHLRPDEKHLASGTVGAWPNSLPPWEK